MGQVLMQHHTGSTGTEAVRCGKLRSPPWSNKPMVPTAPSPPNENPLGPLRRQTGRPLGSRERPRNVRR